MGLFVKHMLASMELSGHILGDGPPAVFINENRFYPDKIRKHLRSLTFKKDTEFGWGRADNSGLLLAFAICLLATDNVSLAKRLAKPFRRCYLTRLNPNSGFRMVINFKQFVEDFEQMKLDKGE